MDEQLEYLMQQDWENIALKVLNSATFIAKSYGWNINSSLPNGKSLEDLVSDSIADLFTIQAEERLIAHW